MERILRTKDVCSYLGISRSTLHSLRKSGEFPPPIQLLRRGVGWRLSTVEQFLNSRSEAASGEQAMSGVPDNNAD